VKPLLAALKRTPQILALAHITGGGFPDNVPRVLPKGLGATLDLSVIEVPEVFRWLAREGRVAEAEMLRAFNCGIGMVVAVARDGAEDAIEALRGTGEEPMVLGEVVAAEGEPRVSYRGKLAL